MTRFLPSLLAAGIAALGAPGLAAGYGWPLKPFDEQHPIRANFDDPRMDATEDGPANSFHFGVDISAPDGTPVYAVEGGVAVRSGHTVSVRSGSSDFAYWHIDPAVRSYTHVRKHQLLGTIQRTWGHVHFAESSGGVYVNPLRFGALEPYVDTAPPVVEAVQVIEDGREADLADVHGIVDFVAAAYDPAVPPPLPPWQDARLTPALVRWRLLHDGVPVFDWRTAADFRSVLLPSALFDLVYAPGTWQNKPSHLGHYNFWLVQGFDTAELADGAYRLEVAASDMRGNVGTGATDFQILNTTKASSR